MMTHPIENSFRGKASSIAARSVLRWEATGQSLDAFFLPEEASVLTGVSHSRPPRYRLPQDNMEGSFGDKKADQLTKTSSRSGQGSPFRITEVTPLSVVLFVCLLAY